MKNHNTLMKANANLCRTISNWAVKNARKVVVCVVGFSLVLLGILLLVLPGPGTVAILAGLGVLGLEFAWARRLLKRGKAYAKGQLDRLQGSDTKQIP